MPFEEFPVPEVPKTWDELQPSISPDAGLDDVPGMTPNDMQRDASFVGKELMGVETDSLYANTNLLNEVLEIRRHVKRLLEEKLAYVVIEKSIAQMGYPKVEIRKAFHRLTGIDPVMAYLDFANYDKPPGAVPTYNLGWGIAKDAKADYFFVMPYADKYAIYKQTGLDKEIVAEHYLLDDARKDLSGKVKVTKDVTPDVADTLSDIVQKVAHVTQLSNAGATFYQDVRVLASQDPDLAAQHTVEALEQERITEKDFQIIAENVILAAPMMDEPELSAPERSDEGEFTDFKQEQEGRGFNEMKNNTLLPGQEFASNWEAQHKVDFWGLLTESKQLFDELASSIDSYKIEPSWGTFRIMPTPNLAVDDDNHILDGSVAVGATVQKLGTNDQAEVALLMFIHNGKLKFSGKFKGSNDKEYGFEEVGFVDYFDDLEGSTALDEKLDQGTGMNNIPGMDNNPMSSP